MSDTPELSTDELAQLEEMRLLAKEVTADDAMLDTPPPGLWDSIQAAGTAAAPDAIDTPEPIDLTGTASDDGATVIQGPWRKAAPLLVGAAAALALLFGGLTVFGSDNLPTPIAEVALSFTEGPGFDPLGEASTGNAAWLNDGDTRCIDLDVAELPSVEDAQLEVWLIDTNVEDMVSLGTIDGNTCLDVPASVDPANLPVVDISIEPNDGVETHSGRSILRGVLDLDTA